MSRFAHQITVGPEAIDQLGHANNIEFVRWIQDVALAHSTHIGLGQEEYRQIGGVFVVRRHAVEYLRSAFEGEVLTVSTWIGALKRVQCERVTEFTNAAGEVVATGLTTWVYVARDTMRPVRIPDEIKQRFGVLAD